MDLTTDWILEVPEMTCELAQQIVGAIAAESSDDEAAHVHEDALRERILIEVTKGHQDSVELARIALSTSEIDFCRWCA
jgi:hypothetical protein